ncbi:MAG: SusC/RagA family TonB-linked outer membrane protein [Chitinophagaceae bacterium]
MRKQTITLLLCLFALMFMVNANAQTKKTITGQVTDSVGTPIIGVSVLLSNGTVIGETDEKGTFSVSIPDTAQTVQLKHVSYATLVVPIGSDGNITAMLAPTITKSDEVVVTAMGIKKDVRKLGYATSVVKGDDIVKTAPTNFASALYGKAPGVTINSNPGGATSAVAIQIRGLNSIGYNRQPLMVVDGAIIRDGDANNDGYWSNQKINGNGLLDINPENIESINILKGAAATALYGSDATFGVIIITTKNGKGSKGLGVDASLAGNIEKVAVTPDVQTEYGPGYDWQSNLTNTGSMDGWRSLTVNGETVSYPYLRAYGQFGTKFDGRSFYYFDGTTRSYTGTNNWNAFYRTGNSTIANIALSNSNDKLTYRFAYTRNDYKGIQIAGKQNKNTFNLNVSYKITPKLTADVVVNYTNELVHNRPRQIYYLTNNYGGFFSSADKMDAFFNKYQTSTGYKWVDYNVTDVNFDIAEKLAYNIRSKDFLDFLWAQLANSYDETTNRLIGSATLNYNILDGLTFRGRMGTDYTGYRTEEKYRSTQRIAAGASGGYGMTSNQYTFTSGDLLLSYNKSLSQDFSFTASAGYQGRKESYYYTGVSTNSGLSVENWFSMAAEAGNYSNSSGSRSYQTKDGLFGILDLNYHDYLFVSGTLRRERTSTLYPGNNEFNYPGISAGFELSKAVRLPSFVNYSKIRAAWGKVGNPPSVYVANVVYTAGNVNGIPTMTAPSSYGNNDLKNEMKTEIEFGWENKLLNGRLGFDVSYYNNTTKGMILDLTLPTSTGASSVKVNVGDMRNYGFELSLYGTPVRGQNFTWDVRWNMGFNKNKLLSLAPNLGLNELILSNFDNGSMYLMAKPGQSTGDIMGYKVKTLDGQKVVNDAGYYDIDYDNLTKVGNIQPKTSGGIINDFTYKAFSLHTLLDYRIGGQIVSLGRLYGTGAGLYKNSLAGRDAEHGGLPYYATQNADGSYTYTGVAAGTTAGPNGETIHNDGMVLSGVTSDGATNTKMIDAPNYYINSYGWGGWPGSGYVNNYADGAVFNNNFIKVREVTLSYNLPKSVLSTLKVKGVTVSAYGRNLFYIYKSLKGLDPEGGVGTDMKSYATSVGSGTAPTRSYGLMLRLTL